MLDNPEKTTKLLAALKAAVPFEVELTEQVVKQLRMDEKHHTVSELSYAGDEGGIVCHIVPPLGLSYKTAWFMCHRIREGMAPKKPSPIGGQNKVVEADETFIGGKKKNRAFAKVEPKKQVVMTLVDRDGESRSIHVADVSAKTLREKP